MSSISRLSIRGIRSFPPDQENVVDFEGKPLTVISGMNGCGKTTIIECLKYGTTGQLPPNSSNGQSFVFDPKIANLSNVLAQVKLEVKHRTRGRVFVSRNLQVAQKKSKLEFKQLEVALKIKRKGGQEESTSGKCVEVDKILPEFMGVSKAILENVIFCHQEESTWPLMESSVLKKKFDDIFESTRYNKALEEVKKQKKRLVANAKDFEKDKDVLEVHRRQANKIAAELSEAQNALEETSSKLAEFESQMAAKRQDLKSAQEKLDLVGKEKKKLQEVSFKFKQLKSDAEAEQKELRSQYPSQFKTIFAQPGSEIAGSIRENLENSKRNMETEILTKQEEVQKAEEEIHTVKKGMEERTRKIHKLDLDKTKLAEQKKQRQILQKRLVEHLLDLQREHAFLEGKFLADVENLNRSNVPTTKQQSSEVLAASIEKLKAAASLASKAVDEKVAHVEKEREVLRRELTSLEKNKNMAEAELNGLEETERNLREKLDDIRRKMKTSRVHLDAKGIDVEQIDGEIETVQEKIREVKASSILINFNQDIEEKKSSISLEQERVSSLRVKVSNLEGEHEQNITFKKGFEDLKAWAKKFYREALQAAEEAQDTKVDSRITDWIADAKTTWSESCGLGEYSSRTGALVENFELHVEPCIADFEKTKDDAKEDSLVNDTKAEQLKLSYVEDSLEDDIKSLRAEISDLSYRTTSGVSEELQTKIDAQNELDVDEIRRDLEEELEAAENKQSSGEKSIQLLQHQIFKTYSRMSRKKHSGSCSNAYCPTCYRHFDDNGDNAYPFDGTAPSHPVHKIDSIQAWFDGSVLKKDLSFSCTVNGKETRIQYKKGDKLQSSQFFVAFLCISVLENTPKNSSELGENVRQAKANLVKFSSISADLIRHKAATSELVAKEAQLSKVKQDQVKVECDLKTMEKERDRAKQDRNAVAKILKDVQILYDRCIGGEKLCSETKAVGKRLGLSDDALANFGSDTDESGSSSIFSASPLEQARLELQNAQDELADLHIQREKVVKDYSDKKEELQSLESRVNELQQQKLTRMESSKTLETLKVAKEECEASLQGSKMKEEELVKKSAAATKLVKEQKQKMEREKDQENKDIATLRSKSSDLEREYSVARIELEQLVGVAQKDVDEEIYEFETKLATLVQEQGAESVALKTKEDALKVAQARERETVEVLTQIERFIRLVGRKIELDDLNQQRSALREKIESVGAEEAEETIELLQKALQSLEKQKAKLEGKLDELQSRVFSLTRDLEQESYRNIEARHKEAAIKWHTTKTAAQDLEKYHTALDTALMQFHQQKIEEINRRIGQLWSVIYTGGDIDRIELRSEKTVTAKTRSFNYRVVMSKFDTQLDMRGRCSAGQKVLASLVIRMALAESFSVNCGILALDEPTTNLDSANKVGLASSLIEILKQVKDSKFQLIVITHDQDFVTDLSKHVQAIGQEANYYRVERQDTTKHQFLSRIVKCD